MIYIKAKEVNSSFDWNNPSVPATNKIVVKFGYTKDDENAKKNRDSCYNTYSPYIQHLKYIEGATEEDEKALHYIFRPYLCWAKEWFEVNDEIREFVNSVNTLDELRAFISSHVKPKRNDLIQNFSQKELRLCAEIILSEAFKDVSLITSIVKYCQIYEELIKNKDQPLHQFCFNQYGIDNIVTKLKVKEKQSNNFNSDLTPEDEAELNQFCLNFKGIFEVKMKMYCEIRDKHSFDSSFIESLNNRIGDYRFDRYYSAFGIKTCKSKKYRPNELDKMASDYTKKDLLKIEILKEFKVGDIILKAQIKQKLKEIYIRLGIKKTPKATDLEEWFVLKSIWVKKTKENFFKIISLK